MPSIFTMDFSTNETNGTDSERGHLSTSNQNLIPNHLDNTNANHPSNAVVASMKGNLRHLDLSRNYQLNFVNQVNSLKLNNTCIYSYIEH